MVLKETGCKIAAKETRSACVPCCREFPLSLLPNILAIFLLSLSNSENMTVECAHMGLAKLL